MICHGPTSLKVHSEYIDQLLVDNGKKDITHFSVRHKLEAWKPYYIHAVFNDNSNYNIKFIDTDYGVAFQNLKRPSCSKCRFKVYDSWYGMPADITIGPEKSRIVNLKRQYSDFLGFKLRAVRKGVKSNGTAKYAVESHMSDKAVKKVKRQTREMVKRIQSPANVNEEYKAIGAYNAYVSGVHNYYRCATHISKDIRKIAFGITRTMQNRLRERLQKQGNPLPAYIAERYGRSKQIRYVSGQAVIPIGYIQAKAPLYKRREVNQYTEQGRRSIHKNLESVNMSILHYLMRNPVQFASVELNNNRLALYCAQHGCCAVTKQPLEIGDIHCHHKLPREKGGNDQYGNLVLVTETVHILIHATDSEVIARLVQTLRLNVRQRAKLNTLRKTAGLFSI